MKKKKFIETYTVEEVAEALKLHPYTIRRLCREGKIPAFSARGSARGRFASGEGSALGRKFGGQCLSAGLSSVVLTKEGTLAKVERFDTREIEEWKRNQGRVVYTRRQNKQWKK